MGESVNQNLFSVTVKAFDLDFDFFLGHFIAFVTSWALVAQFVSFAYIVAVNKIEGRVDHFVLLESECAGILSKEFEVTFLIHDSEIRNALPNVLIFFKFVCFGLAISIGFFPVSRVLDKIS